MLHYVKKLWKKNYWHELRSVRVIAPITMTVIFFGALGRSGNWKLKRQSTTKRKSTLRYLEMKLVKWSKQRIDARNTWTRRNFCTGEWDNNIIYFSILFWKIDNIKPIPTIISTIFQIVLPKAIFTNGWNNKANPT